MFEGPPALVLNANYRPLSVYPLSIWPWEDAVKAVVSDRVEVIETYDIEIRSPSISMLLPSVLVLRHYDNPNRPAPLTRANLFVRDNWTCQYCNTRLPSSELTFEHILPRSRGGATSWVNLVAACVPCNLRKCDRTPKEAKMRLVRDAFQPTLAQLNNAAARARLDPARLPITWHTYLNLATSSSSAFPPSVTSEMYWKVQLDE